MVRREEQPWQARATLLLDSRSIAHGGEGPASSFEWAVAATASVGVHLVRSGYHVRLLTDTGATIEGGNPSLDGGSSDVEGSLLDALAVLQMSSHHTLRDASGALRRGGGDGLLVALLGALDPEEARTPRAAPARHHVGHRRRPRRRHLERRPEPGPAVAGGLRRLGRPAARLRLAGAAGEGRRLAARAVGRGRASRLGRRAPSRRSPAMNHGSLRLPLAAAFATITAAICLGPIFLTGALVLPHGLRGAGRRRRLRGGPADGGVPGHGADRWRRGAPGLPAAALRARPRRSTACCRGPTRVDHLGDLARRGHSDMNNYAAPIGVSPGIELLTVGGVGLVALAVDTLAVTWRRAALAGLPLLVLYTVPTVDRARRRQLGRLRRCAASPSSPCCSRSRASGSAGGAVPCGTAPSAPTTAPRSRPLPWARSAGGSARRRWGWP